MSRIDRLEIALEVLADHNMLEEAEKLERISRPISNVCKNCGEPIEEHYKNGANGCPCRNRTKGEKWNE
jgi:Zn finger protein HypA/HybF involved in hydrogenase expression